MKILVLFLAFSLPMILMGCSSSSCFSQDQAEANFISQGTFYDGFRIELLLDKNRRFKIFVKSDVKTMSADGKALDMTEAGYYLVQKSSVSGIDHEIIMTTDSGDTYTYYLINHVSNTYVFEDIYLELYTADTIIHHPRTLILVKKK